MFGGGPYIAVSDMTEAMTTRCVLSY